MKAAASVDTAATGRKLPRIGGSREAGCVLQQVHGRDNKNRLTGNDSEINLLSVREYQVAAMLAAGKLNKTIAKELGITNRTVSCFVTRARQKLGLANTLQLALHAYSQGWREWKP